MALDDEKFGIDSYQDENGCEGETQGGSDDPFEVVGDFTICEIWCDSRRRRKSRDLLELFPEGRANVYHGWADLSSSSSPLFPEGDLPFFSDPRAR